MLVILPCCSDFCQTPLPQVTPVAVTQQLPAAAKEALRSFRAGISFGGRSSGLEQGAAGTTVESPTPGREREGVLEQVHSERRTEGYTGPERTVKFSLKSWCQCCPFQAGFRVSLHIPASIALASFLVLKSTELFLDPGPLHLLCPLLTPDSLLLFLRLQVLERPSLD